MNCHHALQLGALLLAASPLHAQVEAKGHGSIAIGQVSGSQVQIQIVGPSTDQLTALFEASSSKQAATIRQEIVARLPNEPLTRARLDQVLRELARASRSLNRAQRDMLAANAATQVAQQLLGEQHAQIVERLDGLLERLEGIGRAIDDGLREPGSSERTRQALDSAAGDALARLDFDTAHSILSSLRKIEDKVDDLRRDVREAIDPEEARVLITSERRRALQAVDRLRSLNGASRCAMAYQEIQPWLDASEKAERDGRYLVARTLLVNIYIRASTAAYELDKKDQAELRNAERYARAEVAVRRRLQRLEKTLLMLESIVATQQSRIQAKRNRAEEALRSIPELETLAAQHKASVTAAVAEVDRTQKLLHQAESRAAGKSDADLQARIEDGRSASLAHLKAVANLTTARGELNKAELGLYEARRDIDIRVEPSEIQDLESESAKLLRAKDARTHLKQALEATAGTSAPRDNARAAIVLEAAAHDASDIESGEILMPRPTEPRDASTSPGNICS